MKFQFTIYLITLSIVCFLQIISSHKSSHSHDCLEQYLQPDDVDNTYYDDLDNNPPHICARNCKVDEPPKICYYKFHAESYTSMGGACGGCPLAKSDCHKPQCVTADGFEKTIYTLNRQIPGPCIQVCRRDTIVVDIINLMKGHSIAIHWHGILQNGTQYMDGVPMVTQCPTLEGQTFRYTFLAENPGTYFYHSHSGLQKIDGISGALIIREPKIRDPNGHRYQHSKPSHNVFISDWIHRPAITHYPGLLRENTGQAPDSYLINGKGVNVAANEIHSSSKLTPIQVYYVKAGESYKFHVIAATCLNCQFELIFERHPMLVTNTDDKSMHPVTADKMILSSGERAQVIIEAIQEVKNYWIIVRGLDACKQTFQVAMLCYEGAGSELPPGNPLTPDEGPLVVFNPKNSECIDSSELCIHHMRSSEPTPEQVLKKEPDEKMLVAMSFNMQSSDQTFYKNIFEHYFCPAPSLYFRGLMNNKSLILGPSPLLSQKHDIPKELYCGTKCKDKKEVCNCIHIVRIPLYHTVELLIIDTTAPSTSHVSHPFHIHGHSCHILRIGQFRSPLKESVAQLNRDLESGAYLRDNLPMKDTIVVPSQGYAVVRCFFDNPGFWLFHCHFAFHLEVGMGMIFWVGDLSDLPPVPHNFPKCGNFLPPVCPKH